MTLNPLTLGLALANSVLIVGLVALSMPHEASVAAASDSTPVSAIAQPSPTMPLPALADAMLARAWQQPLFSPTRQPDAIKDAGLSTPALAGTTLAGVVLDGEAQWAWIRLPDHRVLRLKRGDALAGGWVLTGLGPTRATFSHQGQTYTLNIAQRRLPAPAPTTLTKRLDVQTP